nr:glyoxylate/hydroxypyruvate reductase HPR3 [Tanacetum cinerariifolium]
MRIKAITGSLQAGFFSAARSITSDILTNFPELRFIITTTPGIDHIDLHQCRSRGIKVANACTIFSEDVAHMDVGLLIDVLTRVCYNSVWCTSSWFAACRNKSKRLEK